MAPLEIYVLYVLPVGGFLACAVFIIYVLIGKRRAKAKMLNQIIGGDRTFPHMAIDNTKKGAA